MKSITSIGLDLRSQNDRYASQVRVAQCCQDDRLPAELAGIFFRGEKVFLERHFNPSSHPRRGKQLHPPVQDFDDPITVVEQ